MLWSQFSDNFRRKSNVFLKNQKYDKNFAYFSFVSSKNAIFLSEFFGENIFKTITSVPDLFQFPRSSFSREETFSEMTASHQNPRFYETQEPMPGSKNRGKIPEKFQW
jgi:hypothetical protein